MESDAKIIARLQEIAAAHRVPMARGALAWLLQKPGVTAPIIGTSKPQHLEDAVGALSLKLTPQQIKSLEEPYLPRPVAGHE